MLGFVPSTKGGIDVFGVDGKVTISIEDFERLRGYEKAVDKAYDALKKCNFVDEKCETVESKYVLEALEALTIYN